MHEIPDELSRGPFTVARALELGLSLEVLAGTRFRKPWPGVRVLSHHPDTLVERCRALTLALHPAAVFSHETAVELAGWLAPGWVDRPSTRYAPVPALDRPVHVSLPPPLTRPRLPGVVGHRFRPGASDVVSLHGLRLTSPWRSWCDMAAGGATDTELLVLADALRRRHPGSGAVLLGERLEEWGSRRGARSLRRVLARSRDRVDSPMETRLRVLFVDAGLPEPEVNEPVRYPDGDVVHCPDMSWPSWRVAADYDGSHHADRDDVTDVAAGRASDWRARQDTSRREQLEDVGWRLRVFTSFDIFRRPERAVARMRTALQDAGAPV